MKIWSLPGVQSVKSLEDLRRFISQALFNITQALSNGLGFRDNINCEIIELTINTTETTIPHGLGVVPIGFIVINAADFQYPKKGTTAWTTKNIYLIANTQAVFKIAILGS